MSDWKKNVIGDPCWGGTGIYRGRVESGLGTEFHDKMPKGAALRDLRNVPLHLSYWETPYYEKAIRAFLGGIVDPAACTALDVGCGDGRFTEMLIKLGFGRVIASDAHLLPLQSLQSFAEDQGFADRLLLVHCGADNLPFPDQCADAVLAIGVLYYLNNRYEEGLKEIYRVMRPNSVLINSEPDLEGAVYKSLFFEEVDDALENLQARKFKEEKGQTDFKFRLFDQEEMRQLLTRNGFRIVDQHGLSLLPSILRIKMVRGELPEERIRQHADEIRRLFDYFDETGRLYKHIIWKSVK